MRPKKDKQPEPGYGKPTIGATVRLMSGGPLMTIAGFRKPYIVCTWFAGELFQMAAFMPDTLELVPKVSVAQHR